MGRNYISYFSSCSGTGAVNIKNVLVFTSTRSDYGIFYWILKELESCLSVNLQLLVSGTHLSSEYGLTINEIRKDNFIIADTINTLPDENSRYGIAHSVGKSVVAYSKSLKTIAPSIVLILGDRYEAFAMAQAAFLLQIPIAHLHGGEITEGANDDRMRHAITKLSDLHFTSCEIHRRRVIQLGESPENVFVSGAPGLEHIVRSSLPTIENISNKFDFDFSRPYIVIAYHPVTNIDDAGLSELKALLKACSSLVSMRYVISLSNADYESSSVNDELLLFSENQAHNSLVCKSFGHTNFLTILSHAKFLIGNSSSGVIEAPSLHTPSIDIGQRQKGRERARSVVCVEGDENFIRDAMARVMTKRFSEDDFLNPYHQIDSVKIVVEKMLNAVTSPVKKFYDVPSVDYS